MRLPGLSWVIPLLLVVPLVRADTRTPLLLEPAGHLDDARIGPSSLRSHPIYRLAAPSPPGQWRTGDRFSLVLEGEDAASLVVEEVRNGSHSTVQVRGRLEGVPDSVVLLSGVEGEVAGTVWDPRRGVRRLVPKGGGRLEVKAWERASGIRCGNDVGPGTNLRDEWPLGARTSDGAERVNQGFALTTFPGDSTTALASGAAGLESSRGAMVEDHAVIDLLFVYTPAAESGAGGMGPMQALLELAVAEANDAFRRSGARLEIRSVGRVRAGYVESGELATDLGRLVSGSDGWLDEVHGWRDEFAADVVCLVTESEESNQFAGMANQLRDTSATSLSRGFCVCLRPYLIGNFTLPHELGHTFGCHHDRSNAAGGGLEPWSFGTRIEVDGQVYRTVMAYRPGLQFPHFSNPDVTFRGVPTGVAFGSEVANNVRTLNLTAPLMASVRAPVVQVGFSSASVEASEGAGWLRLPLEWRGTPVAGMQFKARTVDGSARAGIQFLPFERELRVDEDGSPVALELGILDDTTAGGTTRLAIELSSPTPGLALGPVAVVNVLLRDDEEDAGALLDTSFRSRPGADHVVTTLVAMPDGAVIVGGSFARYNGAWHPRLARIGVDGDPDETFQTEVKYRVHAASRINDDRLAIAGEFNTVNGVRLNHVAVLRSDGSVDDSFVFEEGTDYPVHAVVPMADGRLYVGGAFKEIKGTPAPRVARLHANGSVDTEFHVRSGPDAEVLTLAAVGDGRLAVGGRFRSVAGVPAGGVVVLQENGEVDTTFRGAGSDGVVRAIAADAAWRLVIGGEFTQFHGEPAGRIVRVTIDGELDPTFQAGSGADDAIETVAVSGEGAVWMGGRFRTVNGRVRMRVAKLRPDGGVDDTFDPGLGPNDAVLALALNPRGEVFIGGVFSEVNGVPRGGVARLMAGPVRTPWLRASGAAPGRPGVAWQARVQDGQSYSVEGSIDLESWETVETRRAMGEWIDGTWDGGGMDRGFLRVRRRLE